ncbi:MAG: DNA recombination protein RmuC [Armatimonadetes bacterium]|nr:DNA recombination protein RmuC [Armatimonadota bacterium]NIM23360.1 DNA recombination protein RmuC [Armatimonadota bacterium]NIM67224.1 DNA recombination protein RmuC [Armatimonadota bacterium]NIM75743.1 DNA recombination protein RmuC [Armatimonadota bacterium]NIN05411.1 DNA recombination protein RmuC [Armatimonadota bacterium]
METALLGVLVLLVIILLGVVIIALFRRSQGADVTLPLQNLTQTLQQDQIQTAALIERIGALSERVTKIEQNQVLGTDSIREALSRAENDLTELQTYAKARREVEQRTADSIRRLEGIIAGTQTKGLAGENILETVFTKLPAEWQVRDFRVGDKVVEFGLRLPNNLVLPIDSKWAATNLLEQFVNCEDADMQQTLKKEIERAVVDKAKEVRKYIDPNLTVNWGVAAVPDAVYDLCSEVQAETLCANVALVSYSMFLPYLLLVFQTILKTAQQIDFQRLDAYLQSSQESISALQEELEGRVSRAITMLSNSRNDMSAHLSKLNSGITSLQIGAGGEEQREA